jgi:hypothetical protein
MIPKIGDEVVLSITCKVEDIICTSWGVDYIRVDSDGIGHSFWPANEKSLTINVIAKAVKSA